MPDSGAIPTEEDERAWRRLELWRQLRRRGIEFAWLAAAAVPGVVGVWALYDLWTNGWTNGRFSAGLALISATATSFCIVMAFIERMQHRINAMAELLADELRCRSTREKT